MTDPTLASSRGHELPVDIKIYSYQNAFIWTPGGFLDLPLSTSCADLLKVLADETRLAVVRKLIEGPMLVGQLNESLQLEQSLLSHHLKVLRLAGLVVAKRDGKAVRYALANNFRSGSSVEAIDLGCCSLSFKNKSPLEDPS